MRSVACHDAVRTAGHYTPMDNGTAELGCPRLPSGRRSRPQAPAVSGGGAELLAARALQHAGHGVYGRGDAHRALHRLARQPVLSQLPLVQHAAEIQLQIHGDGTAIIPID